MSRPTSTWQKVANQPWRFTTQVLTAFQKNQGLLLSGALAYYILLSVIPLFTFVLLMLSHVVDQAALMATLRRYIGLIIPGDSKAVLEQVRNVLEHREVASWVVVVAMLFFSSLAFSVLESAQIPIDRHLSLWQIVGNRNTWQFDDAAFDGVHQREVADRPRKQHPFGVARAAQEERCGPQVINRPQAGLALQRLYS